MQKRVGEFFSDLFKRPVDGLQGHIGPLTSTYIAGWAASDHQQSLKLTVRVNGAEVGQVEPWLPRPDATAATGLGYARGFFFSFPRRLADGALVEVINAGGQQLGGSPTTYRIARLPTDLGFTATRASIAAMFIRGVGLEIGAFTQPTDLPPDAVVEYYDRFPADTLRNFYDETCGRPLVEPKYHGNAQYLEGVVPGKAFDFVIANHVIEHFEDPIAFLRALSAALNRSGRVMLIAPNKRFTFDSDRELTTFEHLLDDHFGGAERNRAPHYAEWVARVDRLTGAAAAQRAEQLEKDDFSIYFHAWDENTFASFVIATIQKFSLPLYLLFSYTAHHEITLILEKT